VYEENGRGGDRWKTAEKQTESDKNERGTTTGSKASKKIVTPAGDEHKGEEPIHIRDEHRACNVGA